jgi:hypothetical protein
VNGHLKHLAMCAPMLVIAVVLLVSGAGVASVVPLLACAAMMVVMMRAMDAGRQHHRGG